MRPSPAPAARARSRHAAAAVAMATAIALGACGGSDDPTMGGGTATTADDAGDGADAAPDDPAGPQRTDEGEGATGTTLRDTEPTALITVAGGAPEGGVKRIEVERGEQVRLAVRSDVAEEVHVHGYDEKAEVEAGGEVLLTFTADRPGTFEIELERSRRKIAELVVSGG